MKTRRSFFSMLLLAVVMLCAAGCTKTEEIQASGTYNGHDYVDLGLPSGTLWATCNVGASSPEDFGDYFAWGETEPKATYDWGNYKYCNGTHKQLTKYCTKASYGYNGFIDHLTYLVLDDDAASANWGVGWRTPTKEQCEELIDNTTSSWKRLNGVKGRLFTAPNGQSVFLPAAGKLKEDDPLDWDGYGLYWLVSLYNSPVEAEHLFFSSDNYSNSFVSYDSRCSGLSVRPVCSPMWNQ